MTQYWHLSLISGCPHKTVPPVAVLPSPHHIQIWNSGKFWIHASYLVCEIRGGGWACVIRRQHHKQHCLPRLLSVIVGKLITSSCVSEVRIRVIHNRNKILRALNTVGWRRYSVEILQNPDVDAIFRSRQCNAASIQPHSPSTLSDSTLPKTV